MKNELTKQQVLDNMREYEELLHETLPILRAAFFANYVQSKKADELYDRIRRAVGRVDDEK